MTCGKQTGRHRADRACEAGILQIAPDAINAVIDADYDNDLKLNILDSICAAIRNICVDGGNKKDKNAQARMRQAKDAGAEKAILRIMKTSPFKEDVRLMRQARGTIVAITRDMKWVLARMQLDDWDPTLAFLGSRWERDMGGDEPQASPGGDEPQASPYSDVD